MNNTLPTSLSDSELLVETARAAGAERRATADILLLLAEADRRKLYLGQGYSSLFTYCTQALHLSEPAAYSRITAARAGRNFPVIFTRLVDGSVSLTTISLLSAHLTLENHEALLGAASHKSKREVEDLVACIDPQPDVVSRISRIPAAPVSQALSSPSPAPVVKEATQATLRSSDHSRRAVVAPLAADRYFMKVTLSEAAHAKLQRARDLLRHQIPNGDPAAIVERALTVLVAELEKTKHASTGRLQVSARTSSTSRRVPSAVRRAVWARDEGRCAFVGTDGRCRETGFLEYHHVVPFARGGPTNAENLQLRCRAHNAYEAALSGQSWDKTQRAAPRDRPRPLLFTTSRTEEDIRSQAGNRKNDVGVGIGHGHHFGARR